MTERDPAEATGERDAGTGKRPASDPALASELTAERARLALALEDSGLGTWELDLRTGASPRRSARHDRIFGYEVPREEWSYDIFLGHVHPDDRAQVDRTCRAAVESGTAWEFECRIRTAAGALRWIWARGTTQQHARDGSPARLMGVVEDITERKQAEQALRESEARLRLALDLAALGTWDWDLRTGEVALDDRGAAIVGLPPGPLGDVAAARNAVVHPDDRPRVEADTRAGLEGGGTFDLEYRVLCPDERIGYVHSRAQVVRDDAGRPIRLWGIIRDITAEREMEERGAFLLALSDALQSAEVNDVPSTVCRMVAERLGASRCDYSHIAGPRGAEIGLVRGEHLRIGRPMPRQFALADFNTTLAADLRAGKAHVRNGADRDPRLDEAERQTYPAVESPAFISVPLVRNGRLEAAFTVHDARPRTWTAAEIALVEEVAVRAWDAVQRATAEAALKESEERLRLFSEASSGVIWMRDAATLRMEYVSPAFEAIYGVPRESILGTEARHDWASMIVKEDRERALAAMERVRAGERVTFEYRIQRPDGEVRWLRDTDFPVRDAEGRVRRVGGIGQDVTELKGAEEALRVSEERHRLIVAGARDYAILVTDLQGRIESWSPGAEAVYGWTAEEIIGQAVEITFTPEDRERGQPARERQLARTEGSAPDVRWHLRKNGDRVFIEGTARALEDGSGRLTGFLKIGQDVTRRRQTEEALKELNESLERRVEERTADLLKALEDRRRALQQLVTAEEEERRRISRELHDQLGQQLTGLLLGLRAVQQAEVAPEQRERLRALERLASDTARDVQSLAVELRPPALDSLGFVAAVQNHLEDWSTRHGIDHDFHAVGLAGARLPAELETTLYRVVQEALTNVLKHASATRVGLLLERRDGVVRAILEDNGEGFDVERTLASPEKARRLGLRGMRERMALLGGEMEIESSPGSGTTLYVRLPAPEVVEVGAEDA